MRTIIAGSRQNITYDEVKQAIKSCPWSDQITIILSGVSLGVDRFAEQYALEHKIPFEPYAADWLAHGNNAGFLRNRIMISKANAVIAISDGLSPNTLDLISLSKKEKLKLWVNTKKQIIEKEPSSFSSREHNAPSKIHISKQQRNASKHRRSNKT